MNSTFKFQKSRNSNVIKSIRFPEELNERIMKVVEKANKSSKNKEYSFNGFVVSACEFALDNMEEENNSKKK